MALPNQFASLATIQSVFWDQNFAALGALTAIPCSVVGTNTLALTPLPNTPTVVAYANYAQFTGVVSVTNSGAVTAQVGSLAALPVYKDTPFGPVALTGGELVAATAFSLLYDAALNSGNGGFHLQTLSALASVSSIQIGNTVSTITDALSTTSSIVFTAMAPAATQDHNVTLAGVSVGDIATLGLPAASSVGLLFNQFVSATNIVTVRATNVTAGTITPGGAVYRLGTLRFSP